MRPMLLTYLNSIMFDVEVTRCPSQVCSVQVACVFNEPNHLGFIQSRRSCADQFAAITFQKWIILQMKHFY